MSALISVYEDNSVIDGRIFGEYENALAGANEADAFNALEMYYRESEILLNARLEGYMVMEEVEVGKKTVENQPRTEKNVKGVINNIKEFFNRIIKFISDALGKFTEAISDSMKNNIEWYRENAKYIETAKSEFANDIKLDVVDYWNTGAEKNMLVPTIPMKPANIKDIIADIIRKGPDNINKDMIYQTYFPDFAKLSHEPKMAAQMYYEGAKAYDENGKNGVLPTSRHFENKDAIKAIDHITAFMGNYQTYINATNQAIKNKENELKSALTYLDGLNNTATEGYSFPPDMYSVVADESVLTFTNVVDENMIPAYKAFLGMSDVAEMGGGLGPVAGQGQSKANGNPPPAGNAANQGGGNPPPAAGTANDQSGQQNAQKDQQTGNMGKFREAANTVAQIYGTIASSRLTAVKRMCDHYCNVLRGVVDGVKKAKGIQDENAANDKYNKEQTARERREQKEKEQKVSDARTLKNKETGGIKGAWRQFWGQPDKK